MARAYVCMKISESPPPWGGAIDLFLVWVLMIYIPTLCTRLLNARGRHDWAPAARQYDKYQNPMCLRNAHIIKMFLLCFFIYDLGFSAKLYHKHDEFNFKLIYFPFPTPDPGYDMGK